MRSRSVEGPDQGVLEGRHTPHTGLFYEHSQAEFLMRGQRLTVRRQKSTQFVGNMDQGNLRSKKPDDDIERPLGRVPCSATQYRCEALLDCGLSIHYLAANGHEAGVGLIHLSRLLRVVALEP